VDVWSFGVAICRVCLLIIIIIIYVYIHIQLINGILLFDGESAFRIQDKILKEGFPDKRDVQS
jgi:hypothetical protein